MPSEVTRQDDRGRAHVDSEVRAIFRASLARLSCLLSAHPRWLLALAASAPFGPGAWQFMSRGIPERLLTGDPATLEIRTLHASHLTQLLGPYSRFHWSHPGPAFFYLALPVYEAFDRRGTALNLFTFLSNLVSAVAIALVAQRLRGGPFAWTVVTLLAVYECVAAPFQLADEWNPFVPVLPFALLSLLCVRLGSGSARAIPLFAFLGSAIVQTHIGYLPVVLVLSVLAAAFSIARRVSVRRVRASAPLAVPARAAGGAPLACSSRRLLSPITATAGVLTLLWLPPIIDSATGHPGNFELLYRFFTAAHTPEHTWATVAMTVCDRLSVLPLAVIQLFGASLVAKPALVLGIGIGETLLLAAGLAAGLRRGDHVLAMLSCVALGEIAAASVAVHAILGEIHWHLVLWISMIGLVTVTALAAWILPTASAERRPAATALLALAACVTLGLCVRTEARHVNVFIPARDEIAEALARGIRRYVVSERVRPPIIRVATHDAWPTVAAVILYLYHESIPFFVEDNWVFLVGTQFRAFSPEHPSLLIGDHSFCEPARSRADLRPVATAGDLCAYLAPKP